MSAPCCQADLFDFEPRRFRPTGHRKPPPLLRGHATSSGEFLRDPAQVSVQFETHLPSEPNTAPVIVGALSAPEDSPLAVTAFLGSAGVLCSSEFAEASVPWKEKRNYTRVGRGGHRHALSEIPTRMAPMT